MRSRYRVYIPAQRKYLPRCSPHLTFCAELFEKGREFVHLVGPICVKILFLREVFTEIEEFAWIQVLDVAILFVEPLGHFADGTGFRRNEDPVPVADRVAVGVRVMD